LPRANRAASGEAFSFSSIRLSSSKPFASSLGLSSISYSSLVSRTGSAHHHHYQQICRRVPSVCCGRPLSPFSTR
jgi:hypothetical protein